MRVHLRVVGNSGGGPSGGGQGAGPGAPRKPQVITCGRRQLTGSALALLQEVADADPPPPPADVRRPRTRGECETGPRPCPWVSCRHHLGLDVSADNGSIKINFPGLPPEDAPATCVLDVADKGPLSLQAVADHLNLTQERVRQIERGALRKLAGQHPGSKTVSHIVQRRRAWLAKGGPT